MSEKDSKENPVDSHGEVTIENGNPESLNAEELEKVFKTKDSKSTNQNNEEYEKLKSDFLYLRAEFDNFRKNAIKERSESLKYGAERFIRQMLTVVDNFDRALSMDINPDNYKDFIAGIEMTSNEFKNQLTNLGVTIDDPVGKAFDPQFHEALSSEESSSVPPGHITQVFQKGYKLHDKIIRPAQVVVAKEATTKKSDTLSNNEETES